jgi:hypothetical protein
MAAADADCYRLTVDYMTAVAVAVAVVVDVVVDVVVVDAAVVADKNAVVGVGLGLDPFLDGSHNLLAGESPDSYKPLA